MRIDPWRAAAIVPVFVYTVVAALWSFTGVTAGVVAGFFLTAMATPAAAIYGRRPLPFAPAGLIAAVVSLLWLVDGAPPSGVLGDVAAGFLLASPLVFLAAVWVTEDLPGTSVAMAIIGLTCGVGLLAATRALTATVNGPPALLAAVGTVAYQQGLAIGVLLRGGVPAAIPMSSIPDALFVLLAILAMVGMLLSLLRGPGPEWVGPSPEGTTAPPAPEAAARGAAPSREVRGILASATLPELPEFPSYSGLYPVLAAAGAAGGFLAIAEFRPTGALLAVAVGVAVGVLYLWRTSSVSSRRSSAPATRGSSSAPKPP